MINNIEKLISFLKEYKCKDIAVYDLSNEGQSCEYMLVSTISNVSNNKKLAESIMQEVGIEQYPEGFNKGEWIVIDFDEILFHSFIPASREKYSIDKLWQSKKVNLD